MGKKIKRSTASLEFELLLHTMKEAREEAKLSQREVASRMGMAETVVGRIERGERAVDVIEFVDFARAIGVDPLALLGTYLVEEQNVRLTKKP